MKTEVRKANHMASSPKQIIFIALALIALVVMFQVASAQYYGGK